jgi:putative ABC transport system ATP-binding protein
MVLAEDVVKVYRSGGGRGVGVRALDGVDLRVEGGTFLALMGASGSGKSTLLHLLGGLDTADSGLIVVEGNDLGAMGDRDRTLFRRRRLGVVFQAFNLLPTLSAVENVMLPLTVDGVAGREARDRAEKLLVEVDLVHRRDHRPDAMSGGEQQRVAIARAMVNDPALILADEPTGNLDSKHGDEIWQLLCRLCAEKGRTVIAVTHELSGARRAGRICVMKDGRIVGEIESDREQHASLVATRYAELAG